MILLRRDFAGLAPLALWQTAPAQSMPAPAIAAGFPARPLELAREMVGVSHGNPVRVKELLEQHPSLAKATWDWAFGDWETALGAASHVGNRPIAELLLENGAEPTLFSAAMLGQLDVVKAMIAAQPGVQRTRGPHSISLLAHARAGGEKSKPVYDYLIELGDADAPTEQQLSDAQLASILGTYEFGSGATERIEINVNKNNQLQFLRIGTTAQRMRHLGNLAFHPVGAPAVRIVFDGSKQLTIYDPGPILTALRMTK